MLSLSLSLLSHFEHLRSSKGGKADLAMPIVMTTWHKHLQEEKERVRARKLEVKLAAELQKPFEGSSSSSSSQHRRGSMASSAGGGRPYAGMPAGSGTSFRRSSVPQHFLNWPHAQRPPGTAPSTAAPGTVIEGGKTAQTQPPSHVRVAVGMRGTGRRRTVDGSYGVPAPAPYTLLAPATLGVPTPVAAPVAAAAPARAPMTMGLTVISGPGEEAVTSRPLAGEEAHGVCHYSESRDGSPRSFRGLPPPNSPSPNSPPADDGGGGGVFGAFRCGAHESACAEVEAMRAEVWDELAALNRDQADEYMYDGDGGLSLDGRLEANARRAAGEAGPPLHPEAARRAAMAIGNDASLVPRQVEGSACVVAGASVAISVPTPTPMLNGVRPPSEAPSLRAASVGRRPSTSGVGRIEALEIEIREMDTTAADSLARRELLTQRLEEMRREDRRRSSLDHSTGYTWSATPRFPAEKKDEPTRALYEEALAPSAAPPPVPAGVVPGSMLYPGAMAVHRRGSAATGPSDTLANAQRSSMDTSRTFSFGTSPRFSVTIASKEPWAPDPLTTFGSGRRDVASKGMTTTPGPGTYSPPLMASPRPGSPLASESAHDYGAVSLKFSDERFRSEIKPSDAPGPGAYHQTTRSVYERRRADEKPPPPVRHTVYSAGRARETTRHPVGVRALAVYKLDEESDAAAADTDAPPNSPQCARSAIEPPVPQSSCIEPVPALRALLSSYGADATDAPVAYEAMGMAAAAHRSAPALSGEGPTTRAKVMSALAVADQDHNRLQVLRTLLAAGPREWCAPPLDDTWPALLTP